MGIDCLSLWLSSCASDLRRVSDAGGASLLAGPCEMTSKLELSVAGSKICEEGLAGSRGALFGGQDPEADNTEHLGGRLGKTATVGNSRNCSLRRPRREEGAEQRLIAIRVSRAHRTVYTTARFPGTI